LEQIYSVEVWARGGAKPLPLPLPTDPDGNEQPHGSVIDFDACPKELLHETVLVRYLAFHGVAVAGTATRTDIERWVGQLIELTARGTAPTIRSPPDEVGGGNTHYQNWEQLMADGPIVWKGADDVMKFVRDTMPAINPAYISEVNTTNGLPPSSTTSSTTTGTLPHQPAPPPTQIFGEGHNGVRLRGYLRVTSGHFNISKWRIARAKLKDNGEDVIVIEARCTPSMKSAEYSVYAVLDLNGAYLGDPSKCDCPDGWLFCSHMLGQILLFYVVQQRPKWSLQELIAAMPEPIKSTQQLPIPVGLIFRELAVEETKLRASLKAIGKNLAKEVPGYTKNIVNMLDDVSTW